MDLGVAVLAQALEVGEAEGDVGIVDVLGREVDLVVHDPGRYQLSPLEAALAHAGRDGAHRGLDGLHEVGLAVLEPPYVVIEGGRESLRQSDTTSQLGLCPTGRARHSAATRRLITTVDTEYNTKGSDIKIYEVLIRFAADVKGLFSEHDLWH